MKRKLTEIVCCPTCLNELSTNELADGHEDTSTGPPRLLGNQRLMRLKLGFFGGVYDVGMPIGRKPALIGVAARLRSLRL